MLFFWAIPVGVVCAAMHLHSYMMFLLLAPFILLFLYPEILAGLATGFLLGNQQGACMTMCNHGLALMPASQGLLTAKALALFRSKNYEEAEAAMTKSLEGRPRPALGLINRAAMRCWLAKFEEAEQDASEAIERAPKKLLAYQNRAVARYGQQNYEGCLEDCFYLQKRGRETPAVRLLMTDCYLITGKIAQAEAVAVKLIGKAKAGSYDALCLAQLQYFRNQFVEVLASCAEVAEHEPLACHFIYLQGFAYWGLSEGELALQAAARALALKPQAENGYLLRAYVLADAGRLDEALSECQAEPVVKSRFSICRDAEAYVFWRRGEWDKMLAASSQAVERCPAAAFSQAMHSLALAGLGRVEEALEAGRKATEVHPLEPRGWHSLANAQLEKGEVAEAIKSLDRGLSADPHDRLSYQLRAQAHRLAGDDKKACVDQARYDQLQSKFIAN